MIADKKKERAYSMPETERKTLEEIARVNKQICERELVKNKKPDLSLWNYKRRLIAHLNSF